MMRTLRALIIACMGGLCTSVHGVLGGDTTASASHRALDPLSIGYPASEALFPASASAWTACIVDEDDGASQMCLPPPERATVCFRAEDIRATFANNARVLGSLFTTLDLFVRVESTNDDSALVLDHMLRILLTEVVGFGVRHQWNPRAGQQLSRCASGELTFASSVWRSEYDDEQWQATLSQPDSVCEIAGTNGWIGMNGWYADTASVQALSVVDAAGERPLELDHWRSYQLEEAVSGLPRLDLTAAANDTAAGRGTWFIPPQCRANGTVCGVAWASNLHVELAEAQQQLIELAWLVALYAPPSAAEWQSLVDDRVSQGQQLLCLGSNVLAYLASPLFTRVSLPPSSGACHDADSSVALAGERRGCEFEAQVLDKIARKPSSSDYHDPANLFSRMRLPSRALPALLAQVRSGVAYPDVACAWLRNHTSVWSTWVAEMTPRIRIIHLSDNFRHTLYGVLAFFTMVSLAAHGFLYVNRMDPVVRRSSHTFCQLLVLGTSFLYASVAIGVQNDSLSTCVSAQFVLSVGFTLFYGSVVVKSIRLFVIFTSTDLSRPTLTTRTLLLLLLAYGILDFLIVLVWMAMEQPSGVLVPHTLEPHALISKCSSSASRIQMRIVLYTLRLLVLAMGIYLAFRIRHISTPFSEVKAIIGVTILLLLMASVIGVLFLSGSNAPQVLVGSWAVGVSVAVFLGLIMFLGPKVWALVHPVWQEANRPRADSTKTQANDEGEDTMMEMPGLSQVQAQAAVPRIAGAVHVHDVTVMPSLHLERIQRPAAHKPAQLCTLPVPQADTPPTASPSLSSGPQQLAIASTQPVTASTPPELNQQQHAHAHTHGPPPVRLFPSPPRSPSPLWPPAVHAHLHSSVSLHADPMDALR